MTNRMIDRLDKNLGVVIKAVDETRMVEARISTTSVDRDGDVMLPSGAELSNYLKNPVVMFAHDGGKLPVGAVPSGGIKRQTDGLTAKVRFAERPESLPNEAEWTPDVIFDLFRQEILRAFSVGFTIQDAREPNKRDIMRFGEKVQRVINRWELLEISVVPLPANQDALAVAVSKGMMDIDGWTCRALTTKVESDALVVPDNRVQCYTDGSKIVLA